MLRRALLLLCCAAALRGADASEQDQQKHHTYMEILSRARALRLEVVELFEGIGKDMKAKDPAAAEKITNVVNNWFSLLGRNTGVTGLAKDFVMNYYSTLEIEQLSPMADDWIWLRTQIVSQADSEMRKEWYKGNEEEFVATVSDLNHRAQAVFNKDGALLNCLRDLENLFENKEVLKMVYLRGQALTNFLMWLSGEEEDWDEDEKKPEL